MFSDSKSVDSFTPQERTPWSAEEEEPPGTCQRGGSRRHACLHLQTSSPPCAVGVPNSDVGEIQKKECPAGRFPPLNFLLRRVLVSPHLSVSVCNLVCVPVWTCTVKRTCCSNMLQQLAQSVGVSAVYDLLRIGVFAQGCGTIVPRIVVVFYSKSHGSVSSHRGVPK